MKKPEATEGSKIMSNADTQADDTNIQNPLAPTRADAIHTGVKIGVASLPVFGGLAAELFDAVITPPISKRRDALLIAVYEGLKELEKRTSSFKIDDLSKNEAFISTFMEIVPIAIRNHRREKLKALRNAVLNSALPTAPDDNLQKIFTHWLDELTVWHLQMLMLFESTPLPDFDLDKPDWFRYNLVLPQLAELIKDKHPEMGEQDPTVYIKLVNDLHSRGLIASQIPDAKGMVAKEHSPKLTRLGQGFLNFFKSPLDETPITSNPY